MKCDCGNGHYYKIDFSLYKSRKHFKNKYCTECNPIDRTNSGLELQLLEFS